MGGGGGLGQDTTNRHELCFSGVFPGSLSKLCPVTNSTLWVDEHELIFTCVFCSQFIVVRGKPQISKVSLAELSFLNCDYYDYHYQLLSNICHSLLCSFDVFCFGFILVAVVLTVSPSLFALDVTGHSNDSYIL